MIRPELIWPNNNSTSSRFRFRLKDEKFYVGDVWNLTDPLQEFVETGLSPAFTKPGLHPPAPAVMTVYNGLGVAEQAISA